MSFPQQRRILTTLVFLVLVGLAVTACESRTVITLPSPPPTQSPQSPSPSVIFTPSETLSPSTGGKPTPSVDPSATPSARPAADELPPLKIEGFSCKGNPKRPVCTGLFDGTVELQMDCAFEPRTTSYRCTAPGERGRPQFYIIICAFEEPRSWVCPRAEG